MIAYDNIGLEDLQNYWGGDGVVFVTSSAGLVNAYHASFPNATHAKLSLADSHVIKYGNPKASLVMPVNDFFEEVLLHRPALGVIVGRRVLLSWQHPNGNQLTKAVYGSDILVTTLEGGPAPPSIREWVKIVVDLHNTLATPDMMMAPSAARQEALDRYIQYPLTYTNPGYIVPRSRPQNFEGINLVLEYINQPSYSLREALSRREASHLDDTLWVDFVRGEHVLKNASQVYGIVQGGRLVPPPDQSPTTRTIANYVFSTLRRSTL